MRSQNQATVARFSLALFVLFALVVAAAPGISLGGSAANALQTTSATPSRSASPTRAATASASATAGATSSPSGTASPAPTGPAIQFLNPSGYSSSSIVSTKDDGTNTTYHLVAVGRQVPDNVLVEFKYQQGSANEQTIGVATRVGTTDTFDMQWNAGALADGSYTLKVIMYAGSIELARDERNVSVNNADTNIPPTDASAETVEIVSPTNGSEAGFFQPAGQATPHTMISVTSSAQIPPPSTSTGTAIVRVFYTVTPPGIEPVWTQCGNETRAATGNDIKCTLVAPNTSPAAVTGLAAVPETSTALIPGSGDAHRVFPYIQVPSSITLSPASQPGKPSAACSDIITATALDQNGRKIVSLNLDVHAKGPSDNLLFDDSGDNSSAHQPPDKAHTQPEATRNCEGTGAGTGNQGQHELSPGNPDIKHIETAAAGTGDLGEFKFQLFSPDMGNTQIAVFADVDNDDQWCADEESSEGSIGWGPSASPSASATASASASASPTPSRSPSASPSGASTARPTGSATAAPSPEPTTLGPELANCPGGTASPSGTGTPTGGQRTITLTSSKRKVPVGRTVTLSGQIDSTSSTCEDNEVVEIRRRIHGTDQFKDFKTTATDAQGNYDTTARVNKSADYQAVTPAAGGCEEAASTTRSVQAKVAISGNYSDLTPNRGSDITIKGAVKPNHRGTRVVLQFKKGTGWKRLDADKLNRRSRYSFTVEVKWAKRTFRVVWPSQDDDHAKGTSRRKTVRAT